jgi:hypothetical protein
MKFQEGDLVRSVYSRKFAHLQNLNNFDYDSSRSLGLVLEVIWDPACGKGYPLYVVEWLSIGASDEIEKFSEQFLEKVKQHQ